MLRAAEDGGQVPKCVESEKAVIAGVMLDFRYMVQVREILSREDFYDPALATLFEHLCALHDNYQHFDLSLFLHRISDDYAAIGGGPFLAEVMQHPSRAIYARQHALHVAEASRQRTLLAAAEDASQGLLRGVGADTVIEKLSRATAESKARADDTPSVKQLLMEMADALEQPEYEGKGIPTGWGQLDHMLGGLRPGLIVVGGRPNMGKSAILQNLTSNLVTNGRPVLACTLEMTAKEWLGRMICGIGEVDGNRYRDRNFLQGDFAQINSASELLSRAPLTLCDASRQTVASIRQKAVQASQKAVGGLSAVVVDYLQKIHAPAEKNVKRYEQVGKIAKDLKDLARDLKIPVVVAAQVNREVSARKDTRPRLTDLRESGEIEAEADVVLFVHRPGYYSRSERADRAEIIVAKQRNGACGNVEMVWQAEFQRFDSTGSQVQEEF